MPDERNDWEFVVDTGPLWETRSVVARFLAGVNPDDTPQTPKPGERRRLRGDDQSDETRR